MELTDNPKLYTLRHSLAHIMAQAVKSLYPEAKLGFGPPTEIGFFYDFDLGGKNLHPDDLGAIEEKMRKIIRENQQFERLELDYEAAKQKLSEGGLDEPYKIENITKLKNQGVGVFSFYTNGQFTDLCEGPHVASTKEIEAKSFKLDRIAGAYWLGDEKNKMLTRIYGLAFGGVEELKDFLKRREFAEKFDHKKLGKELDIFHFDDDVGKGLPLWLPSGTVLRDEIETLAKELEFKYGYKRVWTPHITKRILYDRSGHLAAYKDGMFPPLIEKDPSSGEITEYYLKPMNCPHHHMIYKSRRRSYRDLPLRLAEFGTSYRFEQSGELSGIIRVRAMTLNDAHIYCSFEDVKKELKNTLKLYKEFYTIFKFKDYSFRLSLNDPNDTTKYKGDAKMWSEASKVLVEVLEEEGIKYHPAEGEAAFYGPKIDIQFKNLMGREETVSTIQLDLLSPQNFELTYQDQNDEEVRPVIIHRAPLSTHERIVSYLLEYYGGAFPTWMAPVQLCLIPINESCQDYCQNLANELHRSRVRVEVDDSKNSFNKKIRSNTMRKIPIIAIVGNKEVEQGTLTLRRYGSDVQENLSLAEFKASLNREILERINNREPMGSII